MGNFKYRRRDASAVKERANQSGGAFDSYTDPKIPRYKVQDGDNDIRIMPPPSDIDQERWGQNWGIELWLHSGVGSDKSSYLCIDKMERKPCALCERLRDLDDEDLIDKLKAKKRILCYVIDREDENVGPQLFSMPWTLEKEISGRCIDKKTGEILYIDDPEEGFDVAFTREGKGKKTKYGGEEIARDSTPLCDNQKTQDKWLQFITDNPLPDTLKYYDDEHLRKVFAGQKSRDDDDDDDDKDKDREEERSTRRRPKEEERSERPRRGGRSKEDEDERPTFRAASAETSSRRETDARSADRGRTDETETRSRRSPKKKLTRADVEDMNADELAEVVEAHKLSDVDPDDYPKVAGLRRAVIEALEETGDLEEETTSRRKSSDDEKPTRRASNGEERPSRSSRGKKDEEEEDETERGKESLGRLRDRESRR